MKQAQQIDQDPLRYTVFPIENPDHRQKLHKFITTRGKIKDKASLCRFYLRGICIMKPEYCKFAHSVKQLRLDQEQQSFYWRLTEKQRKKREFTDKKQFNQTALFILKNVKYYVLYDYQFSERFKKSNLSVHDIDTISNDRSVRIRIREIMHRQNWDGFIDFLESRYPNTNYPISFISFWYANFGFDKPQTRCKFGDFLKYSMFVRKYIQVDIIFPPNTFPSIFLVNSNKKQTILQQNIDEIYEKCIEDKKTESKQKMQQFLQKALPQQLSKKYMCRYFMAGNCQQTASQCLYAHSIDQLDYELGQQFPVEYRQPVMPIEVRSSFLSLYEATREYKEYEQYSQQDINLNTTIRGELRTKVHRKLFADFIVLLQNILTNNVLNEPKKQQEPNKEEPNKEDPNKEDLKIFSIAVKDLQKYYQGAGFNHTNQNKFQHLESALWDLGFYMEDVVMKDEATLEKKKITFAYKIPPMEYLDSKYKQIIQECVNIQLKNIGEDGVLLESALKRMVYSYPKKHILPLHVYLRSKNTSFQDVVQQFCQKQQTQKIFFESSEQNLKKLAQLIRKYIKKNKKYIVKIDEIEQYIRNEKKQQVNTNHFMNLRVQIQSIILDIGKKIYYWPFDNNAHMIDSQHFQNYKKNLEIGLQEDESFQQFLQRLNKIQHQETENEKNVENKIKIKELTKERVIVVDNWNALNYAQEYLEGSGKFGVDLEGRLKAGGYVDLIQISAVKKKNGQIQHKQIFVFDIFLMKKMAEQAHQQKQANSEQNTKSEQQQTKFENVNWKMLYKRTIQVLKKLFQNPKKLKILHDSRQDSQALHHILQIKPVTIFDTSGYDIYLAQRSLYGQKHSSSYELLRKLYDVKVPGLNTILDTYKAPNGINIFKESMKKKFGEMGNRQYFENRPIDDEFLEYSARDVEDLVQVWEIMLQGDEEGLAGFIGQLYCSG